MVVNSLKIRLYGDACLRKKSRIVEAVGPGERLLIKAMINTMNSHKGIGLAAPQVGINEQIFVADVGDGPFAVVNPKITKKSIGSETLEEGCLSIPKVQVKVKRAKSIWVEYTNEYNQTVQQQLTDLPSRVFQHELDHLNGKLILDYADIQEKIKLIKQSEELKKSNQKADDASRRSGKV